MESKIKTEIDIPDSYLEILKELEEYDNKLKQVEKFFSYGTSGFRYPDSELEKVIIIIKYK
jgi:hypothetical protein